MQEREFIASGRKVWERLAQSAAEARRVGVKRMGAHTLERMHEDYRRTAADLAYAQTHFPGTKSLAYLNRIVGQAHGELYGASRHRLATAWRFMAREYPRLLRSEWKPIALAGALMIGAAIGGWITVFADPALARMLLPEGFSDVSPSQLAQTKRANAEMVSAYPMISSYIGVNNIQVAIMAFAGGITFGALTVYAMLQNGLMVGVLAGVFGKAHASYPFWALIAPHGSIELPAIIIAGGAGLKMAASLVFPGDLTRAASLKSAAPVAARILLGTVPLFILAAAIEGFFTPSAAPDDLKLAVGAILTVLLAAYVLLPGRAESDAGPDGRAAG